MALLKADFHIHTSEDSKDFIRYSACELIDMAHGLGYQVLSITNHDRCTWSTYLRDYARERGILLIPGMEATIQGKHVLLLNFAFESLSVSSIKDLYALKRQGGLIIAPHPYYPSPVALGRHFTRNLGLFDAVEWSHFFCNAINFNRRMERVAKRAGIPVVGTSDAHQRRQFHTTYSLVEAEFHEDSVIEAVKRGKVKVKTTPLPLKELLRINVTMVFRNLLFKKMGLPDSAILHKRGNSAGTKPS